MVGNWIDANMTPTELLLNRNSHARLVAPAPSKLDLVLKNSEKFAINLNLIG